VNRLDAVAEQFIEVRQLLLAGFVDVVPVVGDAGVAPAHLVLGVLHDVAPAVVLEQCLATVVRDFAVAAFGDELPILEFDIEAELAAGRERGLSEFGIGGKGPDPPALIDFEPGKLATDRVGEFVSEVEAQCIDDEQRNALPALEMFLFLGEELVGVFLADER